MADGVKLNIWLGFCLALEFGLCASVMFEKNLAISAFNIRSLGDKKMGEADVVDIIIKIIQRYDIILIQEIKDVDMEVFGDLLNLVNDGQDTYGGVASDRLGRTVSKEQYGFMYKKSAVTLQDVYLYPDSTNSFERPPFAAKFSSNTGLDGLTVFAIIGIHIKPTDAEEEINKLVDVYNTVRDYWGLDDIIIAGDFNADCTYVSNSRQLTLTLRTDIRFKWFIPDSFDTTSGHTECAYDRFVGAGDKLTAAVIPGSAGVFQYDKAYSLPHEKSLRVSDHYPIYLELRGAVDETELDHYTSTTSMTIKDDRSHQTTQIKRISGSGDFKNRGFVITASIYAGGSKDRTHIVATSQYLQKGELLSTIDDVRDTDSVALIAESTVELIKLYLDSPIMSGMPGGYGLLTHDQDTTYQLSVLCEWDSPHACEFKLTRQVKTPLVVGLPTY